MGQGVSEGLPFAVGVAISPLPVIAVILVLFSSRARVNGPVFALGWVAGLALVSAVVYALVDTIGVSDDSSGSDSVAWLEVALGVLLLLVAGRSWRKRPAPGAEAQMPRWMAGIDAVAPGRALVLAALLSANPKNLVLAFGAAAGVAQLGIPTGDAIVSLVVFVAIGSLTARAAFGLDDLE